MPREVRAALTSSAVLAALGAAALLAAPGALAQEFAREERDPEVRIQAELDLYVNEAAGGTALVIIRRGDVLALPSDLARAGLDVPGGARETIDGRELVSLRSLAPEIRFQVDEKALALRITASPELLGRHTLDLQTSYRPAQLHQRFDPSAFLDYAADSDLAGHVGLTLLGGGRVGRWLATTDVTRRMFDGSWVRGTSAAVRDDPPALQRLTLGDTVASTGNLGGAVGVGGVTFAREWSLDPYLVRNPYPATTAIVTAPSTMEVYVNGAMVRQQALAPGFWDLANLPVPTGQAAVRTVIRDAFGRERTFDSSFYVSSGLLAKGYSDYAFTAGFRREGLGAQSFEYGKPAAAARYRYGETDWLTPETRAEASTDVVSAGAGATVGTRLGELQLDGAASGAGGGTGVAGLLGWSWSAATWNARLRFAAQTDRYATLALSPSTDRPLVDADLSVGFTVARRVGLGVELRSGRYRDRGDFASVGLRGSLQLGPIALSLTSDYGNDAGGPTGAQVFAVLTWTYRGHVGDASTSRDRTGHVVAGASASRPLLRDSTVGYRVHVSGDDRATALDGTIQGQTSFGRAALDAATSEGHTSWHANASGAIVYIDRGVYFARPTDGGYALVQSGGVPNVGVTVENTFAGRTGADGKLLVTELQPYYATRLALVDRDIPPEYEIGKTVGWFAPPYLGGAVARFDVRRISAVTGWLVVRVGGEDERPGNGDLNAIVDGELRTSPVTEDGRFFLERMPPGKHVVQAVWRGGSCRAVVTLPADAPPVWDAGEVRCIPDTLDPSGRIPSLRDPGYATELLPGPEGAGAGSGGR